MTWYAWVLIAAFVARPLAVIALIGQRRKNEPYTPLDGVSALIAAGLYVWAVVALAS